MTVSKQTKQEVLTTEVSTTQEVLTTPFDRDGFIKKHGTKSSAIRALTAEGHERKVVAKMLGIRYQHVRNVLITPIKKAKVVAQ